MGRDDVHQLGDVLIGSAEGRQTGEEEEEEAIDVPPFMKKFD